MHEHTPRVSDSQSKACTRCKQVKPFTDFYTRSGNPHLLCSECKACMMQRSMTRIPVSAQTSLVPSETLAIEVLKRNGIHAMPGKALSYKDVDVIAFGCVRVEVKYAKLNRTKHRESYTFRTTPRQAQRGYLADVVLLICDDGDEPTFHVFKSDDPVFMIKGRIKKGFVYSTGNKYQFRHAPNRVVMTQPMMDAARDRWSLIWNKLKEISEGLRKVD